MINFNKAKDHSFAHALCKKYQQDHKSLCVVVDDVKTSKTLFNELRLYLKPNEVFIFPESEVLPYDHFSTPQNIVKDRFTILNTLKEKSIVITTTKNLYEKLPPISHFQSLSTFSVNDQVNINDFLKILDSNNFKRKDKVEYTNEYAHRGGIVDIYTPIYKSPIRIEFFDTTIESIRFFDEKTQSSLSSIKTFNLSNGSLIPRNKPSVELFKARWRKYFDKKDERDCTIFNKVSDGKEAEGLEIYLPFFFENTHAFKDIFSEYEFLKVDLPESSYFNYINQRFNDENIDISRPLINPKDLFFSDSEVNNFLEYIPKFEIENNYSEYNFDLRNLNTSLLKSQTNFNKVILLSNIASNVNKLQEDSSIPLKELNGQLNDIGDGIYFARHPRIRPLAFRNEILVVHIEADIEKEIVDVVAETSKTDIVDLNPFNKNDLVIHEKYGLGVYEGLEVVETSSVTNEYVKIRYIGNEYLYVPLRNINLLSKYHKSRLLTDIELDSISSNKWTKKKEKALKQAHDHAAEILDIESRRASSSSLSLKVSNDEFDKFNSYFPYNETKDQLIAVDSIRKDLSLIKPMNRLICGDVGFGKTEVAMRAAFVSVYSEKQVIVLCPSTILAKQHLESFTDRFKESPINVSLLNRHITLKDRKVLVEKYNNKEIDILISTHAIFNQKIDYTNTGLLVVDEEHRFGIKQKDLIKSKQDNIHILYLSATPIPRTMNFVFSGLKDFSFLNSPPVNRLSIKSFLKVSDNTILKESISREIQRGGQCFILQNNISKMQGLKNTLETLIAGVKIGIAHGQLNKKDIASVMDDFGSGEIDILICTTIVEMGLDIPNANTMIIEDSHKLGLAQLHQLRGRIGRSNKQGYCYFLIPDAVIPKLASERLESIVRLSKLGSGYFIAQEDMELRGSGEILGDKQSGHIASIGLSLYLSMLKSAIKIKKNDTNKEIIKTDVNFFDSAFISDIYMPSTVERLKIYKLIYDADSHKDIQKIKFFLEDTCGRIPHETSNLLKNATINQLIADLRMPKLTSSSEITSILLSEAVSDGTILKLLELIKTDQSIYSFDNKNRFNIKLIEQNGSLRRDKIINILNDLF